jgi:DNA-binding MarR family transcriptional regulator
VTTTTTEARRRHDDEVAFEVLFCGNPAEERYCGFDVTGLAYAMGWQTARLVAAIKRLEERGVIYVRADNAQHASAYYRVRRPFPYGT